MTIIEELENDFGLKLNISDNVDKSGLPRYLTSGRRFYRLWYDDLEFYLVRLSAPVDSRVLFKELAIYEDILGAQVAFWFDELTKNNRNAYVKHHIPFILVPTQAYLPFLGIIFSKKFFGTHRNDSLPITPNAQKILLFFIYSEKNEYTKRDISEKLEIDPVYVTRGTKELVSRKYLCEKKEGKYVFVFRDITERELFDKSRNALISPVYKTVYVKRTNAITTLLKAGDFALSEISMLNPPDIETYACFKNSELVDDFELIDDPGWADSKKICKVELWNYDPKQLSGTDTVDELSLYSSMMNSTDARVQGEMEKILEDIKWQ